MVFTKLLSPVVAHLHLQGCLMHPYIYDVYHAPASFCQACRAQDISLHCHFMLGFIVNLTKMALVLPQVMLHLGVMMDTARGILFPSPVRLDKNVRVAQELLCLTQVDTSGMPPSGDRSDGVFAMRWFCCACFISVPCRLT